MGVVLFDGVCQFCNSSVHFIIDRDSRRRFRFAALQSPVGQTLLSRFGLSQSDFDSLVLIEDERCFLRSTAALRIARRLNGLWPLLYVFIVVPRFLRDGVYSFIAHRRYRWFGKMDACRIPTPELRERFLEAE